MADYKYIHNDDITISYTSNPPKWPIYFNRDKKIYRIIEGIVHNNGIYTV